MVYNVVLWLMTSCSRITKSRQTQISSLLGTETHYLNFHLFSVKSMKRVEEIKAKRQARFIKNRYVVYALIMLAKFCSGK